MSKGQFCYYCGVEVRSGKRGNKRKEHVPPKMLFRAFDCSSITVPSCHNHNTIRSDQDLAIVAGFMKTLNEGNYKLHPDVQTAIHYETKRSTFETTKRTARLTPFISDLSGNFDDLPHVAYISFPTHDWIRQIMAGLVYDTTQKHDPSIDWEQSVIYSPTWFAGNQKGLEVEEAVRLIFERAEKTQVWEQVDWMDGWSAHPKPYPLGIYRFYLHFAEPVLFKHVFYDNFTWYIGFECSEETKKLLYQKVINSKTF